MKLKMKRTHCFLFCCFIVSVSGFASADGEDKVFFHLKPAPTQLNHYEMIGALGLTNLRMNDSQINVTRSEIDTLIQTNRNNWNTFASQLGIGYINYFQPANITQNAQWFPAIEPQLNIYYLNNNTGMKGNVLRFNSTAFNQLNYTIPVRSTRLMLDAALTVLKKQETSLYVKAGVGNAWNKLSYRDKDNGKNDISCDTQRISLSTVTHANFAWELGAGLLYEFNNHIGVSFEYLYTDFGSVKTSIHSTAEMISAPVHFTMQSQTGLIGMHIAL